MALLPVISLSLGNKCNTVTLTENTSPYNVTTNPGGWGSVNISANDITNSVVNIYDYTGFTLLDTYNLTGLYSGAFAYPTPTSFEILKDTGWAQSDGIYQIRYIITDNSVTPVNYYGDTMHELFLCNLCNCRDSLIHKLIKACDVENIKNLKTQVDQMEIFIYGIQSAFSCGDFSTATTILTAATTYCQTLSDCGCGCSGC